MEMATQVKRIDQLSPCKVRITVEIGDDTIREQERSETQRFRQVAKIRGFRPGHAPMELVKQHYREEIQNRVLSQCMENSLTQALETSKLLPVNPPQIHFKTPFEIGKIFEFEAEFEIEPKIQLARYLGIPLKLNQIEVTEDEVNASLDGLRERMAVLEPLDSPRPQKGDFAVVRIGYAMVSSGKKGDPSLCTVEIGAGSLLPDLETALLEMEVHENRMVNTKYPGDYHDRVLAGESCLFDCTLLELKKKVVPEPSNAFANQLKEGLTLETLRNQIREDIKKGKERAKRQGQEKEIMDNLISQHRFEVPSSMVEEKSRRLLQSMEEDCKQKGLSFPEPKTKDLEAIHKRAQYLIKGSLLLREIAKKEAIHLDETRFETHLGLIAQRLKRPVDETKKMLSANNALDRIKEEILTEQVFDFLISHGLYHGK